MIRVIDVISKIFVIRMITIIGVIRVIDVNGILPARQQQQRERGRDQLARFDSEAEMKGERPQGENDTKLCLLLR